MMDVDRSRAGVPFAPQLMARQRHGAGGSTMARPIWSGTLSFGLVTIPVGLHTAVRDLGPHFNLLRESDHSRIRYEKVADADRRPVGKEDLVKGYEVSKGEYVEVTDEDFAKAALKKDRVIDILDFVKAEEIDDRYFNKPYYLTPGNGGAKAYALLREAIRRAGRIGVAKFVMRDKQYLAAIEAIGSALVLTTMRFQEELVDAKGFDFPKATDVRGKDLQLAEQLVNTLASEWDPAKYTNEYRRNLMAVIEAKRKRVRPKLEAADQPESAQVIDLMERLRKSLGQRKSAPPPRAKRRAKTRRAHRAA
jgi:DNA end-binding protein Ku